MESAYILCEMFAGNLLNHLWRNYEIARAIKILRSFDFTLAEIEDILDKCRDESDMIKQLHAKLIEIQGKIHRYQDIFLSIELIIQNEKESAMKSKQTFEIEKKLSKQC
ncbi:hypothetical protein GF337_19340 [candidate division KSB1 bacterium]|nr:hypothetical protein [candidate division KSB1 bacterium]